MDLRSIRIGILGGGTMAETILRGILRAHLLSPEQIMVSDITADRLSSLKTAHAIRTTLDNHELVSGSDVIILAVKPQSMPVLLDEIKVVSTPEKLYLSIAAGITSAALAAGLEQKGRVLRIMPNVAARVLESATAMAPGPAATQADLALARKLFEAIGQVVVINESLMDAVTGLSGSGPAFIFLIIEALSDAGVHAGLSRQAAVHLAAQTCFGAARLVLETGEHPGRLKDQVTSPGGTTIAGLQVLECRALRGSLMEAVAAAVARSRELGDQ
jgi:pyrroline-5-carboxylate reductase